VELIPKEQGANKTTVCFAWKMPQNAVFDKVMPEMMQGGKTRVYNLGNIFTMVNI